MAQRKSLGSLGVEHEDVDLDFDYFGQTIRVHPDAGELSYMEFVGRAVEIEEDDPKGVVLTMEYLKQQVHPDDWDTFYRLARARKQSVKDLMEISKAILEETSGFPTGESSDSPSTPATGPQRSRAGSPSRASSRDAKSTAALTLLKGRPDLQVAVERAQERSAG